MKLKELRTSFRLSIRQSWINNWLTDSSACSSMFALGIFGDEPYTLFLC